MKAPVYVCMHVGHSTSASPVMSQALHPACHLRPHARARCCAAERKPWTARLHPAVPARRGARSARYCRGRALNACCAASPEDSGGRGAHHGAAADDPRAEGRRRDDEIVEEVNTRGRRRDDEIVAEVNAGPTLLGRASRHPGSLVIPGVSSFWESRHSRHSNRLVTPGAHRPSGLTTTRHWPAPRRRRDAACRVMPRVA